MRSFVFGSSAFVLDQDGGAVAVVYLRRASSYLVTNKGSVLVSLLNQRGSRSSMLLDSSWAVIAWTGSDQVRDGNVVQMGDCLATEPLAVPRTSDIVQGLPRIDRLFEVSDAESWMQTRQTPFWLLRLRMGSYKPGWPGSSKRRLRGSF